MVHHVARPRHPRLRQRLEQEQRTSETNRLPSLGDRAARGAGLHDDCPRIGDERHGAVASRETSTSGGAPRRELGNQEVVFPDASLELSVRLWKHVVEGSAEHCDGVAAERERLLVSEGVEYSGKTILCQSLPRDLERLLRCSRRVYELQRQGDGHRLPPRHEGWPHAHALLRLGEPGAASRDPIERPERQAFAFADATNVRPEQDVMHELTIRPAAGHLRPKRA